MAPNQYRGFRKVKWTSEIVINEIKRIHSLEENLNATNIRKKYSSLYYAASRHCGSWQEALSQAGFKYETLNRSVLSKEEILNEIKALSLQGEDLSTKNVRKNHKKLHDYAYRKFGSWKNACLKLGIEVNSRKQWSEDKVISEIKRFHDSGESLHSRNLQEKYNSLLKAAIRYYSSWDNAVTRAGFDIHEVKRSGKREASRKISEAAIKRNNSIENLEYQKEKIIGELREMYSSGVGFSYKSFSNGYSGLRERMIKYFGSIENAINEAGFDYENIKKKNRVRKWTIDKILSEIKRIHSNDEPLNVSYIIQNHRPLYRACVAHIGSWDEALGLVGIDYNKIKNNVIENVKQKSTIYTESYVIQELRKMKSLGMVLSKKNISEYSSPLIDACYNRFGSLENAINAAGFKYSEEYNLARKDWLNRQMEVQQKWSPELIINEILRLKTDGSPLTTSYIKRHHQSLYDGANNHIGSWAKAVEAAGLNYQEIREDKHKASYCGMLFEKLVDELLSELGILYKKHDHDKWNPDYVLKNDVWMDAKLSQWTVFESKTIDRYIQHCKLLVIVYMRGRRGDIGDEIINEKVRLLSVYNLIKQLHKYKQAYYVNKIAEIENKLSEFENWV